MKIHNVFIAALGADIQYYSALARSLDSSLGNMLEKMAIKIASLHYEVSQHVEGIIYKEQTEYIADILEEYKRHARKPSTADYAGITNRRSPNSEISKRHESDYYLRDDETGTHYLIELKIGGDLDNKKHVRKRKPCWNSIAYWLIRSVLKITSVFASPRLTTVTVKAAHGNKAGFCSFSPKTSC